MARKLEVEIVGDASSLHKAFGAASDSGSKFGSVIGGVGKAAAGAGLVLGGALAVGAKIGFDEFNEGQRVAAQTESVLKSTGGAANVTADQISNLAGELLKKSGVDDEAIQSGENLLLTFTNIKNEAGAGNDIFNQTTKTMLDMSVALGQDTSTSAIQLGKALNDPIKGVSALQRVGVSFTADQKEQIKTLVESGKTMDAQKLILAELGKEFGGSAEAAGKTFSGQINIAKETLNNFAGDMVGKAMPAMTGLFNRFVDILPKLESFARTVVEDLQPVIEGWAGIIEEHLVPVIQKLREVGTEAIGKVAEVIKDNGPQLRTIFKNLGEVIDNLASVIVPILDVAFTKVLPLAIKVLIPVLVGLTEGMKDVSAAIKVVAGWVGTTIDKLEDLGKWVQKQWGAHKRELEEGFEAITKPITVLYDALAKVFNVLKDIVGYAEKLKSVGSFIGKFIPGGDPADPNFIPMGTAVGPLTGGESSISSQLWDELAMAKADGLVLSSGYRPGAVTKHGTPSDHGQFPSHAIDVAGSPNNMARFFMSLIGRPGIKQAFYDPLGSIFGGALSSYREGGHSDHVHVASYMHRGGIVGTDGDDVPITAQRGEGLFTPAQMAALGPGGSETHLHLHVGTLAVGNPREIVEALEPEIRRILFVVQQQNVTSGVR